MDLEDMKIRALNREFKTIHVVIPFRSIYNTIGKRCIVYKYNNNMMI